jgi:hypothetical protein
VVTARSYGRPEYRLSGRTYTLATVGGGLRFTPVKGWSVSAHLAIPVKAPLDEVSDKPRLFFSISRSV